MSPRTPSTILILAAWAVGFSQTPPEIVAKALATRDSVQAAKLALDSAKKLRLSAGVILPTRLEFGTASRPDVGGGEDLTLFQPLDFFGKSRASGSVANGLVLQAIANLQQARLDVQESVLIAYANWTNAERVRQNAVEQLSLSQELSAATAKRVQSRALPEIQLLRAGLDVERQQQVLVDRTALVEAALVKLGQATGQSLAVDGLQAYDLALPGEQGTPMIEHRPDLLLAVADRDTAHAEANQARLSLLPDVEIQARRAPWSTSEQYGLRIQFVLPLWDHGSARNRQAAAKIREAAAEATYQDRLKLANADVASSEILLIAAEKSVAAYTKLVQGARDLLQKTQRGFELGASTLIDVIDARRAVADALDLLAASKLNRDLAIQINLKAKGQIIGEAK